MHYILIFALYTYQGVAPSNIEFNSKASCEAAKEQVDALQYKGSNAGQTAFSMCVPK